MENKLTKILAVFAVLGFLAAGPVAYAESQGDQSEGGGGWKHGESKEFFKELNLTPEQKEKIKAQRHAKKQAHQALRDQLKAKMQLLHETIAKPGTTRVDVNGLVAEMSALKGQMFSQRIDGIFAMKAVLTPEQFAKMQAKHKEWMGKKHKERGEKDQGLQQD